MCQRGCMACKDQQCLPACLSACLPACLPAAWESCCAVCTKCGTSNACLPAAWESSCAACTKCEAQELLVSGAWARRQRQRQPQWRLCAGRQQSRTPAVHLGCRAWSAQRTGCVRGAVGWHIGALIKWDASPNGHIVWSFLLWVCAQG